MKPTDNGIPRAHLLGLPFTVDLSSPKLPTVDPQPVASPPRAPEYTGSQYSQTVVETKLPAPDSAHLPNTKPRHRLFGAMSSCCSASRPRTPPATATVHAHGDTRGEEEVPALDSPHTQSHAMGICCSGSPRPSEDSSLKHLGDIAISGEQEDVELGPPNFERVVLRIDGLKCGCCESGLSRAVGRIPAVRDFQVNTVLARVELELDTNRLSVDKIIELLETRTGYKFEEQVAVAGQVLEFIITDPRRLQHAVQPRGVTRVEAPERAPWRPFGLLSGRTGTAQKKTADVNGDADIEDSPRGTSKLRLPPTKIYYDANVIGAREVYEHYLKYDPDLSLAPLVADPGLDLGAKQTRRALKWFLPTLAFTVPVLILAWTPLNHENPTFAHMSLALATVVQLIAFYQFVPNALRSLYHSHVLEMDFLVTFSMPATICVHKIRLLTPYFRRYHHGVRFQRHILQVPT